MSPDGVLVTGATGFLGHSLVAQLNALGLPVRALVRPTSDVKQLQTLGVKLVTGDVTDADSVNAAARGCRFVIHAAGLFRFWGAPQDFERTNVGGTTNVLAAARAAGVERLVHISTVAVIGLPKAGETITEATACDPHDAYQRSKLAGENVVRQFALAGRVPAVILRPGAFYGPWGRYAFNRLFFEDPLKGLLIGVHRGRRLTFPVFVPDVARAAVAALNAGRAGEVYNISGESLRHTVVNGVVSYLAGLPNFRLNVPAAAMLALARWSTRRAETTGREPYYPINLASYVFHDWQVSSAKACAELGFTPTPFADGARQTLEWYWDAGIYRRPRHVPAPGAVAPSSVEAIP